MSEPALKPKKIKEQKELDYSKLPDHIWEKHLRELQESMMDIEQSLDWMARSIERLNKHYGLE